MNVHVLNAERVYKLYFKLRSVYICNTVLVSVQVLATEGDRGNAWFSGHVEHLPEPMSPVVRYPYTGICAPRQSSAELLFY